MPNPALAEPAPFGYRFAYVLISDDQDPYAWYIRIYCNSEGETWASRTPITHREARDIKYDRSNWYMRQLPLGSRYCNF